ncbi:MAG: PrsW family glutamic-type intramembrane protease, partial [Thermomicrobiales bacterium]
MRNLKFSMLLGAALLALAMFSAAEGSVSTLAIATVAAVVPAIVYVLAILSFDRYEQEPLRAIAYAFSWGATGAVLFSVVAEGVFAGITTAAAGEDAAGALTLIVGAPLIEESFKGLALLILLRTYRHELNSVLDGLVYGAVIGIGFAMT